MKLTRYEQEVVINFNVEEDTATLYSTNPAWIRKMDKLAADNPEEFKLTDTQTIDGDVISKTYEMPKKLISIRSKTTKRDLSEEDRERLSQLAKERFAHAEINSTQNS